MSVRKQIPVKSTTRWQRVVPMAIVAICTAAAMPSWAGTVKFPYYSYMYRMGSSANDSSTVLTTTPKLAFSGMTLSDVAKRLAEGYVLGAYQCGTSMARRQIQAKDVLLCRDPETDAVVKIVGVFVFVDGGYTKSVSAELTDGTDGVYARAAGAQYVSGSNPNFVFAELDGNGDVIYSRDSGKSGKANPGNLAVGWETVGYGACSLSLVKPVPRSPALFFANAQGEPVLTVEDIRDYDITAALCGVSVAPAYVGQAMSVCNKNVETNAAGVATAIRVEFQYKEGNYLKCAVVEFTNGESGVYAQQTHSVYLTNGTIGYNFIMNDGTLNTITGSSAPGYYGQCGILNDSSGYGAFNLSAIPPSQPTMLWNKAENMIAKTHNVPDVSKLPVLTTTWTKWLDGISLQEMVEDGYEISAYFCGGSVNTKQKVYAKGFQSYTPSGETSISNAICWFVIYDGGHTKSATIELESRADGVYAKYGKGQYLNKKNNVNFTFAWLDDNGNVVYECTQTDHSSTDSGNYPTTWTTAGYGIAGLKASRFMKQNESRLVFANPVGEPVLTLDDIKNYYLGCSFAGSSISVNDGEGIGMYRAFEYDGNDSVSLMRVEYQVYDGNYNKCSVVNFTNGVDGVYGYVATTRYAGYKAGKLGAHFVNADGTFAGTGGTVVTNSLTAGYGIYDLFATPMITLDRDTDWSATDGAIQLGDAVVDLNGHNLTLQGVSGNGTLQYPYSQIFNSNNSVMSEVHFNVSGGLSFSNSTVHFGTSNAFLNNNIKFVKEGNGTFVGAIGQPCKGGTEFVAGTLKAGVAGTSNPFGATPQTFELDAGLVFDINGQWDFDAYSFVLNGGKLTNTGTDNTNVQGQFKTVTLTADSSFELPHSCGMIGSSYAATTLDLAGHKLTVDVSAGKAFFLSNATISNGTIELRNDAVDGKLLTGQDGGNASANGTNHAETVDFKVGCALWLYAPLSVRNYEALYDRNSNNGWAAFNIHGAFKPSAHDYFHGCTMQDGSTIDLSLREAALPLVSVFTNTNSDRTLKFADGATVYVALGGKRFAGGKVISWNEKPANIGTVKFRSAPGERKCAFVAKDDGLYTMSGMTILVK